MKESIETGKCIELLTAMLNTTVSYPKFTQVKLKGQMEDVPTGSIAVSPFTEGEISTIKALLFIKVQDGIDNGVLAAKAKEREDAKAEALAAIKTEVPAETPVV